MFLKGHVQTLPAAKHFTGYIKMAPLLHHSPHLILVGETIVMEDIMRLLALLQYLEILMTGGLAIQEQQPGPTIIP